MQAWEQALQAYEAKSRHLDLIKKQSKQKKQQRHKLLTATGGGGGAGGEGSPPPSPQGEVGQGAAAGTALTEDDHTSALDRLLV